MSSSASFSSTNPFAKHKYKVYPVSGTNFEVSEKYQVIKPLGRGAYGIVCAAKNQETNEKVAIKKICNVFEDLTDAKRTLRELRLLRHLNHENIIKIRDIIPPKRPNFEEIYIVSELMDTDTYQIIRSSQPLTDDHVQYFIYQILRALKYLHSAGVIHRDLKPSNILVNENCDIKICDFGLARVSEKDLHEMTLYVVTRWYRSPELLLMNNEYSSAIDIWSVGCILAEFIARKPLFPGKDYRHQLEVVLDIIGTPSYEEIASVPSEKTRRRLLERPRKKRPFATIFPKANPLAIDLLERMLMFDPNKRITAAQALEHPYLATYHDPTDEPIAPRAFQHEFETLTMTKEVIQGRMDLTVLVLSSSLLFFFIATILLLRE
eukprot:TRINITY_DN9115_c0_g1_i3.p1 TRINITY_DN9115_c0_g1~~TRINITY_DN9115_c0_g1_i3.p1  ORF type:complete len:378 (+),score=67.87 TRINITY_DN9115_c0_g1_i3:60-1193(+)